MYGGGALSAAQKAQLGTLKTEAERLRNFITDLFKQKTNAEQRAAALQPGVSDANHEYEVAAGDYAETKGDADKCEADVRADEADLRGRELTCEQKVDAAEADVRATDAYKREQVDPLMDKIKELEGWLELQWYQWVRKLGEREEMAKLQAKLQTEANFGEILRAAFAAMLRMNAAVLAVPAGPALSAALGLFIYLTIPAEILEAGWEAPLEQLRSAQSEYAARFDRWIEKLYDPYNRQEVTEADARLSKARQKLAVDRPKFTDADAAAAAAKTGREDAYVGAKDARAGLEPIQKLIAEYEGKIREAQDKLAANADKQNGILQNA
jgi:hypothetical protein